MEEGKTSKADKQKDNSNKPWLFQPGVSGNPKGRPKGKTLKEWCRDQLTNLDDDERVAFLKTIPREVVWQMAEGRPSTSTEITGKDGKDLFNNDQQQKGKEAVKSLLDS